MTPALIITKDIVIILLCCLALGKGAAWFVDAAARLAQKLGISELVIGLTVVAFGSSAPEFMVTTIAAFQGSADISVANVIGSNIFNIGFILGGCALLMTVQARPALVYRDGAVLLLSSLLLLLMLLNNQLSRTQGILFFSLLIVYIVVLIRLRDTTVIEQEIPRDHVPVSRDLIFFSLGLALIFLGAHFLVHAASEAAALIGMSEKAIGLTVVAAGTSAPEFVISLVAVLKQHHGISAGNLIGSNIFNTLGVLGIAALLKPLTVDPSVRVDVFALIALTIVVIVFLRTGWKISRVEGTLLVLIGLAIWIYTLAGHAFT